MKNLRKFMAAALALVMTMSVLVTGAAAADVDPEQGDAMVTAMMSDGVAADADSGVSVMSTEWFRLGGTSNFTLVASNTNGINGNLYIGVQNFEPSRYRMDITMTGRDGLVFSEDDCLGNSSSRTFWCGSDVTIVRIRIVPRNVLIPTKVFDVSVTY